MCAAGNYRLEVEETPVYPACFDLDNIISVASLNADLGFSYYSNYGTESVDIAAVGREVTSLWPEGAYGEMSGTSMAAAQVSGGAAVAAQQKASAAGIKAAVFNSADKYSHLTNKVVDGRSLNIDNLAGGIENTEEQTVSYADDFDVHGYVPTPEESWELFGGLRNKQVVAGEDFTAALKEDGSVWTWGNNTRGQLGDGTTKDSSVPKQVVGLTDIVQIAAEGQAMAAIKSDGSVWHWGSNTSGEAGSGIVGNSVLPTKVIGINDAKAVAVSLSATHILKTDGTVWNCGSNVYGESGTGISSDCQMVAIQTQINDVIKIEAGIYCIAALKNDGTVWGFGTFLGSDTENGTETPVVLPHLNTMASFSIGAFHVAAIDNQGRVWAWGDNEFGQLCDDTSLYRATPYCLTGETSDVDISSLPSTPSPTTSDQGDIIYNRTYQGDHALADASIQENENSISVAKDYTGESYIRMYAESTTDCFLVKTKLLHRTVLLLRQKSPLTILEQIYS